MSRVLIKKSLKKVSYLCTAALLAMSLTACGGDNAKEFQEEGRKLMQEGNANGAIVFFKNALDKDSKNFELRFDLAKAYLKAGKIAQAETELKKSLLQQPSNKEVLFMAAQLNTDSRKPEKALEYLQSIETEHGATADTRELSAINYIFLRKFIEAEQAYNDAIALDPKNSSFKVSLARLNLAQGRPEEAKKSLDTILQEDQNNTEALQLRASLAMQEKDSTLAQSLYKRLITLLPKDVSPSFSLGSLLVSQGKTKEAEVVLESMRKNFKANAQEHMLAGMIAYQNKQIPEANTFFQQSVDMAPSIDGFLRLAVTLHQMKNSESALSNLRRILDVAPTHGSALMLTGQILFEQKRYEEAEREIKRFVENYSRSAEGFNLLGTIQNALGKEDDALVSLEKALELNPKMSQATMNRTNILLAQNHEVEAVKELEKSIRANSESVSARTALFNFYMGKHDYAKASQVVEEGLAEQPDHPLLLTLKAGLQLSEKKNEEAIETLKRAYAIEPKFLPASQLLLNIYMTSNRTQEALDMCNAYLEHDPENVSFLVTSAMLLDSLKQTEQATKRLEKANALGSPRALESLVRRAMQAKDLVKAEKYLTDTLAAAPSVQVRGMLVSFYMQQKNVEKALAIYNTPELKDSLEALLGTFRIYTTEKNTEQALATAEKIIQLHPNAPTGYMFKAMALEGKNDFAGAVKVLEDAYKSTQVTQLLIQLGELYLRQNNYTKALSYFHTTLLKLPKSKEALVGQGFAHLQQKDFEKAVVSYEKAFELYPEDIVVLNNLSTALAEEGKNTARAVELATKAYVGAPENQAVIDTYAFALLANKQIAEALNIIENGIKTHPNSGQLYYRLGLAYLADSKRSEGVQALKKAVELGGFDDMEKAKDLITDNE